MRALFLVNPLAGGRGNRRAVETALARFDAAGWNTTTVRTVTPQHAGELIESAHGEGYDLLIVAGGDGTVHRAVQHLPLGSYEEPSKLPFAIFPMGSGNDFFRGTGAPRDPDGAAENIIRGRAVPIDIGVCEPISESGEPRAEGSVRFINTAGVGMDSQTLATRERAPARLSARYELLFLMTLMRLYPLRVSMKSDDWDLDVDAYWVLCCNSGYIGSGMRVAPDAKINDGLFDVLIIEKMSKWKFIANLPRVFKATHLQMDGVEIRPARTLTLKCEPNQRVATDGDRACEGPVRIKMLPGAVSLWTSRLGGEKVE